jgi:hypothetical protein
MAHADAHPTARGQSLTVSTESELIDNAAARVTGQSVA